jgi:hypothetical protein
MASTSGVSVPGVVVVGVRKHGWGLSGQGCAAGQAREQSGAVTQWNPAAFCTGVGCVLTAVAVVAGSMGGAGASDLAWCASHARKQSTVNTERQGSGADGRACMK